MPKFLLEDFWETPPGQLALAWEQSVYAEEVENLFGSVAVQLGDPPFDTLRANRMQERWLLAEARAQNPAASSVLCDFTQLPVASDSISLVTLPHILDLYEQRLCILQEVARILEPEGRLVATFFNPLGLWWWRQRLTALGGAPYLPDALQKVSLQDLRHALSELGLDMEHGRFGVYQPGCRTLKRLRSWNWLNKAGDRWAPQCSNLIMISAVKRRAGGRIIECGKWLPKVDPQTAPAVSSRTSARKSAPSPSTSEIMDGRQPTETSDPIHG